MAARRLILLRPLVLILAAVAAGGAEKAGAGDRTPRIVAHRGLLRHAPENTVANFRACLELRIGFEFDVRATRDGQLVCLHDPTLDRTTSGTGPVSARSLAEVRRLDAGRWFDPAFAGERVPTVEEVLTLLAEYPRSDVLVAVDLKAENVAAEVVRMAERLGVLPRLLFIGNAISEPSVRDQVRGASARAHTAALANHAGEFAGALAADNADWVYVRFLPSPEQAAAAHRAGKPIFLAGPTVSGTEPENWRRAAEVGTDAILTDDPLALSASLRRQAAP
jgi:glycerophosphoryl diester phosphodiesterase